MSLSCYYHSVYVFTFLILQGLGIFSHLANFPSKINPNLWWCAALHLIRLCITGRWTATLKITYTFEEIIVYAHYKIAFLNTVYARQNGFPSWPSLDTFGLSIWLLPCLILELASSLVLLSLKRHHGTQKLVQMQFALWSFQQKGRHWTPFLLHVHGSFLIADSHWLTSLDRVKPL